MNYLNAFQSKFNQLVTRVRHNFSWYDNLVTDTGYDERANPYQLPYITESILNDNYYESDLSNLENSHVYLTSGTSTGRRKKVIYSLQEHLDYINQRKEIFSKFISSDCQVACCDLGIGHAADSAAEIFKMLGMKHFNIDHRKPIDEHIEMLNIYQPDVILTMPVILTNIISTNQLKFKPKKIIVVGDVASKTWKNNVVDHFCLQKKDLLDIVGSTEVGSIAYECNECGLYHFDNHIIPEVIKSSELYKNFKLQNSSNILVLTSTTRNYFPAIRFVTNDLIEGFEIHECCGENKFSFEKILGRIGSELKHGEKISLYDISEAVNKFLPEAKFDVYKDNHSFIIKVCSAHFTFEIAEMIKNFVRELNPDIDKMIKSSLIEDIQIVSVAENQITSNVKKAFLKK
jgi:fumarate---(S)-2,3-diaminopropanoate ligase